ncbi:MAG: tetratricopeptide repeat protein [Desulfobacterales bacterium]|nr:MAG: tetratricopeptide repeat protein [Desulfobacterales bacterium]
MRRKVICYLILLLLLAISAYGENATDYFNLGLKSTATHTKIKYFSKALELAPNMVEAYENRGMLYYFQRKFENAIQDFQTYLTLAPPKAETHRMLGTCYLKSKDYSSAIYHLTRAIDMDPDLASAYSARAEAYFLKGNYDITIFDATKAIELDGNPRDIADAFRARAKAYRKIGKNDLSAADIRTSWQIDPRYAYYYKALYGYANPEGMRKAGFIVIIAIAFVIIFGVKLKPPEKDE